MGNDIFTKTAYLKQLEVWKLLRKEPCNFAKIFLKFLMIKHDHVWEKWTPDLASKLKLSIDFRSENGSDEFWVRWHTMLWFSTCPSPFPIGVYDTDKHYTTNQSWAQLHYEIGLEFSLITFSFNSIKSYGSTFTSNFKIVYHRHAQPYAIVKYVKINPFLNGWPLEQLKAYFFWYFWITVENRRKHLNSVDL